MATNKTIYYLPTSGQLGNQLAIMAHLLAFANQYQYTVVYPGIGYLLNMMDVERLRHNHFRFHKWLANNSFSQMTSAAVRLMCGGKNRQIGNTLFVNEPFTVEKQFNSSRQPSAIVVTHWLFRYYEGIKEQQNTIRRQLYFKDGAYNRANELLANLDKAGGSHTKVGVHIRRGDYATWLDGKYFYDNDTYYSKMLSLSRQVENPVFIVCSNEELAFDNRENLRIVYAKGSPADDMVLMSKCSYIMGPPSSFSSWSAFLGDQKLLFLETKDTAVTLDGFTHYYL